MNAEVGETKKGKRARGRPKGSRNRSILSLGTSSSASGSIPTRVDVSNVEKIKRENEDMVGRYVCKMFCGDRLMGLVLGFDDETSKFKVVYEDRSSDFVDKETLLRTLAPPTLIDWLFVSHRMPILLWFLQQKILETEEGAGRLKFVIVGNDGVDEHMIWLIELKNLISRQFPHVAKEHIVRLVLDLNHRSLLVIRRKQVVGGITFRPFLSQGFAEIAFYAVMGDEEKKGCGFRLMNRFKQHVRDREGVSHLLTSAPTTLVDFLIKQGFQKEISLEEGRWKEYIKDHAGGILMECKLDPKCPYSDLTTVTSHQKAVIIEKIREICSSGIVYPGIDFQKGEAGVPSRQIKVEDIPGLKEAGWTPDQYGHSRFKASNSSEDTASNLESLTLFMLSLLKEISDHPDAWPFKEPVNADNAPEYYDIIKDPIDLKTITTRVESKRYYITMEMFLADMRRMFVNARTYNMPHTIYYKCANRLESFFSGKFQSSLQDSKFRRN